MLTPLSLAANIVTVLICSIVVDPSIREFFRFPPSGQLFNSPIGGVEKQYPSSISPHPWFIAIYILLLYVGQLGYCVLLVLAQKQETKAILWRMMYLTVVSPFTP